MTDLVVRPDAYQNVPVEVRGYLSNEFEDVFLYPDALSYENYRSQCAVRLDIAPADRAKFDRFRGEYVQLRGTFTGFAIREITQVDELGDRAAPRARVPAPPPLRPEETPRK